MDTPVHDVDVVPAHELVLERRVHDRVGVLDAAERLVGQDDAEAEGVVGGVALPHGDLAAGVEPFEQGGGVQSAGTAADDGDTQRRAGPPGHGRRGQHGARARQHGAGRFRGARIARGDHGYRPRHFGARFSVKAAWNSA